MEAKRQRHLQFSDGGDDDRQERYRRVAELVANGKITTASHLFTEAAAREADKRARHAQEPNR